ncbi:MAG: hypothetical protein JSW10_09635 [Pseudomonadota bacterium]|nr:MAG: hypothetical protein JSW10_09635 [Pseudomonadota bacterium]
MNRNLSTLALFGALFGALSGATAVLAMGAQSSTNATASDPGREAPAAAFKARPGAAAGNQALQGEWQSGCDGQGATRLRLRVAGDRIAIDQLGYRDAACTQANRVRYYVARGHLSGRRQAAQPTGGERSNVGFYYARAEVAARFPTRVPVALRVEGSSKAPVLRLYIEGEPTLSFTPAPSPVASGT